MTSEFEQNLEKYAEVIVKVGLNIQPGQRLLIGPPLWDTFGAKLEIAPLIRLIAAKAYQAGARLVDVMWGDEQLQLIRLQHAPADSFEEYPLWRADGAIDAAKEGDAILFISAWDPDLFLNQDSERIAKTYRASAEHMKPFFDLRGRNVMNLSIIAAPVEGWADSVFPELPPAERLDQFWDALFEICRVKQPDPIAAWKAHVAELASRSEYLNNKQYAALHMTAVGTDLKLGLPEGHIWKGATSTSQGGITYTTNIPTEEIFTLPHKDHVEGFVTTTKPAVFDEVTAEDIKLTFSKGKVVKATARIGEDFIQRRLQLDDGASRLGEVALVPHSSPISQSGRLFHTTLIDENAACHIALGRAYKISLQGGEEMSNEEFAEHGGNDSLMHVDLMIGSDEMDVDGLNEDGSSEPIMRDGEWAFHL